MQLAQYADRRSGSLSGGNKRKLSVAMAIIGEPPVIFLDEPSTGMDPFARRFMWSVIQDIAEKRRQSVVVLTTHSMEEAEALCSKIAIQVDGQLRCFGSAQQLRSQYGKGYEVACKFSATPQESVELLCGQWSVDKDDQMQRPRALEVLAGDAERLKAATEAMGPLAGDVDHVLARTLAEWCSTHERLRQIEAFLKDHSQDVALLEWHGPTARWRMGDLNESHLANLMRDITEKKKSFGLSDFSINQASLEQIFNAFAAEAGQTASSPS